MERVCSKCGSSGPFPPKGTWCKACRAAYQREWVKVHPRVNAAEEAKEWRRTNPSRWQSIHTKSEMKRRQARKKVAPQKGHRWTAEEATQAVRKRWNK